MRRALLAGLLVLAGALAGTAAPALAAPFLSVESPTSGTVTNQSRPVVSGLTSDTEDPVTVNVFQGGSFVESAQARPEGSSEWSVRLPELKDGSYTISAEQTESLTEETATSGTVSVTIDTRPPVVTLATLASPTNNPTPSFSGTASDTTEVTVYVHKGSSTSGPIATEASASPTGGEWSAGPVGHLADGTYTAIAEQTSSIGNEPGFSSPTTFVVHASKPKVTLNSISSPTSERTPSFSGTASEESPVTIRVYEGSSAGGEQVAEAQAPGTGGSWSSGPASAALRDGSYTAVAEQESEFGNGPGTSGEIHFRVETPAPSVSLEPISALSNDTTPSFAGSASEKSQVTVSIYAGGTAKGVAERTLTAAGTGGSWSSGAVSPPLGEGSYTAVAEQKGAFANGTGRSGEIHFTVITASPHLTLNPLARSGDTTPSFTGTASEKETVSILIYAGTSASGTEVASASAPGTGGAFTSGHALPELADGVYTAIAEQPSSLGNAPGRSNAVTFEVDTSSPVVTLSSIPSPSKNTAPTFTGTATDSTTVVVHVLHEGEQVASASGAPSSGNWKSGSLSRSLPSGTYTAFAEQSSSLGNPPGKSAAIGFVVNTASPVVKLNQPAPRSGNATPSFSGTASDTTPVTVEVLKGGSLVRTVEAGAPAEGGQWSSPSVSPALGNGTYTAVAVQPSSLGNPAGHSETRTFEVNTNAPIVTVNQPASPSNDRTPFFTGTANEDAPVHVHVLEGATQIRELTATPSGEAWKTEPLSSALATGHHEYKVYATQESTVEKGSGKSEELPFIVDTTSPVVSLESVKTPSDVAAPVFHGTASDTTPVTVEIFEGTTATGSALTSATQTSKLGNEWSAASPKLGDGTYTAVAVQRSSLENPPGRSGAVTFVINTKPPVVVLSAFESPSRNRAPSFSGTASDSTEHVVVQVLEGGSQVASAEATPSGGKWKTGPVSPELPAGEHSYTVVATQKSSLGNPEGRSEELPYKLDTLPPTVTMKAIATPSNDAEPSFSGTATDVGEVKVVVKAGGKQVGEAHGAVTAGNWSAGPIKLLSTKTTYTAVATQASSLGNPAGESKPPITFLVDPSAPSISMSPVKPQIGTATPTFTGTAGDTTPVFVAICKASKPLCEAEHGEVEAESPRGGPWSATVTTPLEDGEYKAVAWQKTLGGAVGATAPQNFTVDTTAPEVTINAPGEGTSVSGSTLALNGLAGTGPHDLQAVTIQLFAGGSATGTALQTVSVPASGGQWNATLDGLSPGPYTVRATQSDEAGNVGASQRSFTDIGTRAPTAGPTAAFTWFPARPHVGEPVTLVSISNDSVSPITSYAWNTLGSAFAAGGQRQTTTFTTRGNHLVRLRVTDGAALSSVASQEIPVGYPLMRPFPVVRIVTTRSGGSLRLKLLTVEAPAGATVSVNCTGKACPVRVLSRIVPRPKGKATAPPAMTFPRLQRALPAGIALEVRVTQPGKIGKFTRLTIRKGKLPLRADACVSSTEPKPVSCGS